ncbi:MAG: rhomboid family intramembrane serine protease [Planctomycetota bacterium]
MNEDFRPFVTWLCLGAIVAVFLRFGLDAEGDATRFVRAGCVVPAFVATGEWWRLLTANFVHFGFFHLFMNGYALFLLGPRLEWELGHLRYLLLVVLSGTGGTALATLLGPPYFHLAGFSAALFGFLGAHMAIGIRVGRGLTNFIHSPGGRWLLTLLAINFMIGLMPQWNISNEAHLGGLVLGFLVTMHLFRIVRYEPKPVNAAWTLLLWGALIAYCLHPVQDPWFLARAWTAPEGSVRRGAGPRRARARRRGQVNSCAGCARGRGWTTRRRDRAQLGRAEAGPAHQLRHVEHRRGGHRRPAVRDGRWRLRPASVARGPLAALNARVRIRACPPCPRRGSA